MGGEWALAVAWSESKDPRHYTSAHSTPHLSAVTASSYCRRRMAARRMKSTMKVPSLTLRFDETAHP